MSKNMNSRRSNEPYDKHMEHLDQTPLGKLQQQYWTTKQQVIKKLGKKEDEYVVMSDAELDAKLDLFETIEESSTDLMKVIDIYQDKLITLSIEESEMSRFLKSQSTYDTKTKAGKMMAAVAKAQNFSSQQRAALRLPLVRLFNEVETFRNRAITDTYLTIKKMENSRTEYRGALLWMKNISLELDPDTTKKLEKFRRVQAQVKKTKTKFDRLKTDVIQKIDLLAASRCNMFSHVLVNYQKNLIMFWEKTAKTMNAVADAYKGYQYYEFNIIKDLVEPSKRVAALVKSNETNKSAINDENVESKSDKKSLKDGDNDLISINDETSENKNSSTNPDSLIDLNTTEKSEQNGKKSYEDEVNELIDLMTLNEASTINEQLKELEQLDLEKKQRNQSTNSNGSNKSQQQNSQQITQNPSATNNKKSDLMSLFGSKLPFDFINQSKQNPISSTQIASIISNDLVNLNTQNKSFNDLLNTASDDFEKEWASAFSKSAPLSNNTASGSSDSPSYNNKTNEDEFGFFISATDCVASNMSPTKQSKSTNEINSLFPSQLMNTNSNKPQDLLSSKKQEQAQSTNNDKKSNKSLSAWYDLFAELDPLKNPDAIGDNKASEEERNC